LQVQNLEFFFLKDSIFEVARAKNRLLEKYNDEKKFIVCKFKNGFFSFLQGVFFLYYGLARPKNGLIKKKHITFSSFSEFIFWSYELTRPKKWILELKESTF
jgi:hypothetical protein